ncbi:MAG TPA: thioredoxin domain-containing protein [Anaerolineales bacterium]|nr:thioredoxin domain-containing protein [Anaerolineales bacterium]
MSPERKSRRQERREAMLRRERRNRLLTIGLITVGAAFLVFAVVWPQLRPVAEVVVLEPGTYTNADDNTMGDPNAPITIQEFADFQCPFCERFHNETEPLLIQYYIDTGKVHFIFRSMGNFVSDNIARGRGTPATTESRDAAMAAYCAGDQNKFWDMKAHIFANVLGEDVGSFADRRIKQIAEAAGLNMEEFNSCYDSEKYADRVRQDFEDGQASGVTGTPGFVVSYEVDGETKTKLIEGAQSFNVFQQELEAILNEMGATVD